jgi:hypothetical protein
VYSFSPGFTLFSSQWNGPGSTIKDRHSLGKIHSLQVTLCLVSGGMAQGGEWSSFRNQKSYSSLLEKNSPDSSSLMSYFLRADALPGSHKCEWKNGPDDSVYIITLFLCRLILDDCYEDCMTVDVYYYG